MLYICTNVNVEYIMRNLNVWAIIDMYVRSFLMGDNNNEENK